MLTRARAGVCKPNPRYAHTVSTAAISPIPKSARAALQDPNWFAAMQAEFDALRANETWALVPRPAGVNVVSGKWVFRHKLNPDGSLDRYKARWVVRGFSQFPGIDFGDTFSPVVKPATIRTVLSIIASKNWPAHQLDVSNAFLHGHLQEQVFAQQPVGFVDPARPHHVCSLSKSLYGLKQAPRAWFFRFTGHIKTLGFTATQSDSSLFVLRRGAETAFLLLYVHDMVLTASADALLRAIIAQLQQEFKIKDMGPLPSFLAWMSNVLPLGSFSAKVNMLKMCLNALAWQIASCCQPLLIRSLSYLPRMEIFSQILHIIAALQGLYNT
ncbi:hypothetical protein C2845_PM02G14540 [Panicum miliaceum]|uniref:Reverse transcriptase Ty1/copia-type domain-containing protein n=1 Tax=Panicum miliaceum TaxID=4540 RepID=A0A3L6S8B1_PANMI|nr:hypothetical protein C2845_PM02G14540 [Panicum miliaceum]